MVKFHGKYNIEQFWLDWFGVHGGRELGTNKEPHRKFTDNPRDLLTFVEECKNEHEEGEHCRPCWISAQPMRAYGKILGIEKLFYDFDDDYIVCPKCGKKGEKLGIRIKGQKGKYCPKCSQRLTKKDTRPRKDVVGKEVKDFIEGAEFVQPFEPFVVETRKGYHVYVFLRNLYVFEKTRNIKLLTELYKELMNYLVIGGFYKMDKLIVGDIARMARVPLTPHELTGEICQVVDRDLKPTKIRNLDYYRHYGIHDNVVVKCYENIKRRIEKEYAERRGEVEGEQSNFQSKNRNGFKGDIRPCFRYVMEIGEASHAQRLAWLLEIYYSGYDTPQKMLELCRNTWTDFKEKISKQQINDFFKHRRWRWNPYRCTTIMAKGWCIEKDCTIWRKNFR